MPVPTLPPSLLLLRADQPADQFPLDQDRIVVGREAGCDLVLPDPSVSRRHAEFLRQGAETSVRDLGSRNGVRVNGVPRTQANLQEGDQIQIGKFQMRFTSGRPTPAAPRRLRSEQRLEPALDQTRQLRLHLPELREERHLAALYHVCFWAVEAIEQEGAEQRFLELLLEGVQAEEVQLYAADGSLRQRVRADGADRKDPSFKFAPYLARRLQQLPEATALEGREFERFQDRARQFHFLAAPLRGGPPGESCPFIVLLRSSQCQPFAVPERTLVQAATQVWIRREGARVEFSRLRRENSELKAKAGASAGFLGASAALETLRARLRKAASTAATVLLTGETGSGKEVAAQFVHQHSPRAAQPFVKVNCAAIPEGLIESELFGHVRGAFTDAKSDRKGKFALAHGGTLFLDEVGELPAALQPKLLRAIETGEIEPVGAEAPVQVDARILAATNRDLGALVRRGQFREDLFYRLNVVSVSIPPLREHPDDIPALASHFLREFCRQNGLAELTFSPAALERLAHHPWPGNVRELRNVVQRCAIEAASALISPPEVEQALVSR